MSRKSWLVASACFATLLSASAVNATPTTVNIYGTFTDSVTNTTAGDNAPSIDNTGGLLRGTPPNPPTAGTYFNVDNLASNGTPGNATTGGGLLFTVDPAGCLNSTHCNGTSTVYTETADINVMFDFYSSTGALLGTLNDTALATFNYKNQTDNLCWLDGSVTGTAVVSHTAAGGACNAPGSGITPTGYEQIQIALGSSVYDVNLHDWNDWDETPAINFALVCATNCNTGGQGNPNPVPEPFTLSLFGVGLAGAGILRRRKKKTV